MIVNLRVQGSQRKKIIFTWLVINDSHKLIAARNSCFDFLIWIGPDPQTTTIVWVKNRRLCDHSDQFNSYINCTCEGNLQEEGD